MSQLERLYRIERMLLNERPVSLQTMLDTLEISKATLKRDLAYLRDRLNVPIVYDRFEGGYRIQADGGRSKYELPGLWFSAEEVRALLTMHKLLSDLDSGGLLGPHIAPLIQRIRFIMSSDMASFEDTLKRIKIQPSSQHRPLTPENFQPVSSALLQGHRLAMDYRARSTNATEHREISPQRLIHYRDNWYLAAYCHSRKAVRIFSLDAMRDVVVLEARSRPVAAATLAQVLDSGYGIYNGGDLQWATLQFDAQSARWAKDEQWHPAQKVEVPAEGGIRIGIPYLDASELAADILRWGPGVKVIKPAALKNLVKERLQATLAQY